MWPGVLIIGRLFLVVSCLAECSAAAHGTRLALLHVNWKSCTLRYRGIYQVNEVVFSKTFSNDFYRQPIRSTGLTGRKSVKCSCTLRQTGQSMVTTSMRYDRAAILYVVTTGAAFHYGTEMSLACPYLPSAKKSVLISLACRSVVWYAH